jgi:large subunit ribosomal protein L29
MKTKEYREWVNKPLEEIEQKLKDTRAELFNLRYQKTLNQLKDISAIRNARKDIARMEFLLSERRKQG